MPAAKKKGATASRKRGAVADAAVALTEDTNGNGVHSDDAQNGVADNAAPKTSARGKKKDTPEPVEEQAAPPAKPVKGRPKKQAALAAIVQQEEDAEVAAVAPEPVNGADEDPFENVPDSTSAIVAPVKKGRGKKAAEPATSLAVEQPTEDTVAVKQKRTKRAAEKDIETEVATNDVANSTVVPPESAATNPAGKKRGKTAATEVPVETLPVELKTKRTRGAQKTETAAADTNAKQPKQNKKAKVAVTIPEEIPEPSVAAEEIPEPSAAAEETPEPVPAAEETPKPVIAAEETTVNMKESEASGAVAKPVKAVGKKVATKAAKKMVPDESAVAAEQAMTEIENKARSLNGAQPATAVESEPENAAAAVENTKTEVVTTAETAVVNGKSSRKRAVAEQTDETAAEAKPKKKAKVAAKPKATGEIEHTDEAGTNVEIAASNGKSSRKRAATVKTDKTAADDKPIKIAKAAAKPKAGRKHASSAEPNETAADATDDQQLLT